MTVPVSPMSCAMRREKDVTKAMPAPTRRMEKKKKAIEGLPTMAARTSAMCASPPEDLS